MEIVKRADEESERVVKVCVGWIRHSGFKPSDPSSIRYGWQFEGGEAGRR